jgi:hypothetical protein
MPMENPGNPLLPYFAIRITAELKKNAIPTPTVNRNQISCEASDTAPQRRAAVEDIIIPIMAEVRGLYLAAKIPAGIWNRPIPMKNAADAEPSRETSLLNSNATSGNIAATLNQFIPYTILVIIKEEDAESSEPNVLLFFLFFFCVLISNASPFF